MLRFSQNGNFMAPQFHDWNHKVAAFRAEWNHMGSIKLPSLCQVYLGPASTNFAILRGCDDYPEGLETSEYALI